MLIVFVSPFTGSTSPSSLALMQVRTKVIRDRRAVWIAVGGSALYTRLVDADTAVARAAIVGDGVRVLKFSDPLGRLRGINNATIFPNNR